MEQRPLRLGDLVDDYCPRERRITNHAIVAIVENAIRQTRCSTCEAEHVYKEAKVPRRRKSDAPAADAAAEVIPAAAAVAEASSPAAVADVAIDMPRDEPAEEVPARAAAGADAGADADEASDGEAADDDRDSSPEPVWSTHRRLIRATLPKVEGDEPPPRPIPEFTMHQRQSRGSHMFRGGHGMQGNGPGRNGFRHGRSADGNGQPNGNGDGNGPPHGQGGGRGQGQGDGQGGRPGRSGRSGRRRHKRPR
jgi:hypothetical protein